MKKVLFAGISCILILWGGMCATTLSAESASVQGDDFSAPDAVVYQFDFESTNQCWAIRTLNGIPFGIPGSEQVVNGTCPGCSGTKSLQFQVNFQVANEHKGQIEYSSERGCSITRSIPARAEFSTWIYLEQDGPGNLEAEFWVQDTNAHNWAWHASRPTVALQPGQWVRLIGEGSWTSNAWFNPVLKFGIEIKPTPGTAIPPGVIPIQVDDIVISERTSLHDFDFETGTQCWRIRSLNGTSFGISDSESTVASTCPTCSPTHSFQFQVNFQTANDHKGQVEYSTERGCPLASAIPPNTRFSTWLYLPPGAPGNLEAEFFVQDTSAHNWTWHASRPTVDLEPGQWVRLYGENSWTSGFWANPALKIGIEIKSEAGTPIPGGIVTVQMDDVRLTTPTPPTLRQYLPSIRTPATLPLVTWAYRGASVAGYWVNAYDPAGNAYQTVDYLASVGVDTVAVVTTWFQDTLTDTVMYADPHATPSDVQLVALIDYAHSKGLKVMLKPHIDPLTGWRAHFDPTNPAAWFQHFENDFILHYARLAEAHHVELYCLGAELDSMTAATYEDEWEDIIADVRAVYHGKLTYAATEGKIRGNDLSVHFWQSLDYAALTVYFGVSQVRTPVVDDAVRAWLSSQYKGFLEQWHARHGKPIIFAEIGYRSIDFAGVESWRGEGPNGCNAGGPNYPACSIAYNGAGQANQYEALFRAMGRQPWLAGIFAWQFEPRAGCTGITGGVGNTDYAFYGKPAGQVFHHWFGASDPPPALTYPNLTAPLIDHFNYVDGASAQRTWLVQSSGSMALTADSAVYAPVTGNSWSTRIQSHVPDDDPRYAQLVGYFCEGHRDWSQYHSLEIWVRADGLRGEPAGSEFSIALIDSRSQSREIWQSSRFLDRRFMPEQPNGWIRARISLTAGNDRNPWRHPTDFVVPTWETVQNGQLNLNALRGIWIKTLTARNPSQYPDIMIWVDEATASTDTVSVIPAPTLPVLDAVEYANSDDARFVWKRNPDLTGTLTLTIDPTQRAPVANSTRSLKIESNIPCASGGLATASNYLLGGPYDLRGYRSLNLRIRGDQVNASPYGGEFSVILIDKDGEKWQATRWLDRTSGSNAPSTYNRWDWAKISLTASTADREPWYHPADFVIPEWETVHNGVLDLDQVQAIVVRSRTTDTDCAHYPRQVAWIDQLQASTNVVAPPPLPALPVIDHFEYLDDDILRIIWRSASSGQVVIFSDASTHAPVPGSTRSMRIEAHVPTADDRYAQVCTNFLNGPLDFSPYHHLDISVRGDGVNAPPYGGEFSIMLIEWDAAVERNDGEKWQSSRWFNRTSSWSTPLSIGLSGSGQGDPWDHPNDFIVPSWETRYDGVLNLHSIKGVCIKALTTNQSSGNYPDFSVWVDELKLR